MGQEAKCRVVARGRTSVGTAHLDTDQLLFAGEFRLRIPFADLRDVAVRQGELEVAYGTESAVFELGPLAEKWAQKIRHPKSVLDKLGVKPEHKVSLYKMADEKLRTDLAGRCPDLSTRLRKDSDVVVASFDERSDLAELARLAESIRPAGMIWVIWPKGRKSINGDDVFAAAKDQSLVGVKVCSVSETLSGVKVVIPVGRR